MAIVRNTTDSINGKGPVFHLRSKEVGSSIFAVIAVIRYILRTIANLKL